MGWGEKGERGVDEGRGGGDWERLMGRIWGEGAMEGT